MPHDRSHPTLFHHMSILPVEILQLVCEYAGEQVAPLSTRDCKSAFEVDASTAIHYLSLSGFSRASRSCREVSIPYFFQSVTVRTTERASSVVVSPLFHHVRHVHLPAVDVLTCRRPIPPAVLKLVSQATSMRITATNPSFFLTARTLMSRLLHSAKVLDKLELYSCPILPQLDTLSLIGSLISVCPKSLKALYFTMPGGQPEAPGVQTLLNALSSTNTEFNHTLPELETLGLSVHLIPMLAARPDQLALAIACRLPTLRRVTFIAPRKNPRREIPVLELIGPKDGSRVYDFKRDAMSWEVQRSQDGVCADFRGKDAMHLEGVQLTSLELVH
ncbi:F-box-like domain protein, putative [Rhizoctonia solani AG-3 Rhs1AP]|uniref:F-box-like domain protein, putative n=1 Tax=Rhizoctonia solani AG-3 Rhs1AP TaxID=1086054 RepID=X8JT92_9AGAM|nr:F-box-like domain protein, putative [Rhizoctonia solani AG-3 Rhs1AP]